MASKLPRVVSEVERRAFLLQVYSELQVRGEDIEGYSRFHQIISRIQGVLVEEWGLSLGYRFDGENLFGPWDDALQEDIEILDFRGLVDNHDRSVTSSSKGVRTGISRDVYTHQLSPTQVGLADAKVRRDFWVDEAWGLSEGSMRKALRKALR